MDSDALSDGHHVALAPIVSRSLQGLIERVHHSREPTAVIEERSLEYQGIPSGKS